MSQARSRRSGAESLSPSHRYTVFAAENGAASVCNSHRGRRRSAAPAAPPRHRRTTGSLPGSGRLTVVCQKLRTSVPAAPLLSSGLAPGNSAKLALEAYLRDKKHHFVNRRATAARSRRRCPAPLSPRPQQDQGSGGTRHGGRSAAPPRETRFAAPSLSLSSLKLKGTHLPSR